MSRAHVRERKRGSEPLIDRIKRRRRLTTQSAQISAPQLDKRSSQWGALKSCGHIAQVSVLLVGIAAYVFTVAPLYTKKWLDEKANLATDQLRVLEEQRRALNASLLKMSNDTLAQRVRNEEIQLLLAIKGDELRAALQANRAGRSEASTAYAAQVRTTLADLFRNLRGCAFPLDFVGIEISLAHGGLDNCLPRWRETLWKTARIREKDRVAILVALDGISVEKVATYRSVRDEYLERRGLILAAEKAKRSTTQDEVRQLEIALGRAHQDALFSVRRLVDQIAEVVEAAALANARKIDVEEAR